MLDGSPPIESVGSNFGASAEPGEPDHDGLTVGGADRLVPLDGERSAPVTFEVCGNDFDSVLGVYTGSRVDELTRVALNDQSPCGRPCIRAAG